VGAAGPIIPAGRCGTGTKGRSVIEVKAIHPELAHVGAFNSRDIHLSIGPWFLGYHLAMARPNCPGAVIHHRYGDTTNSRAAADGTTRTATFPWPGHFPHSTTVIQCRWQQVTCAFPHAIGSIVILEPAADCCASRPHSDYWVLLSDTTPFVPSDTPPRLRNGQELERAIRTRGPRSFRTPIRTPGRKADMCVCNQPAQTT